MSPGGGSDACPKPGLCAPSAATCGLDCAPGTAVKLGAGISDDNLTMSVEHVSTCHVIVSVEHVPTCHIIVSVERVPTVTL